MASNWKPTQKEAEDFYRLYKSGHDADRLRADISVSEQTIKFWTTLRDIEHDRTASYALNVMLPYRAEILDRFNCLVEGIDYVPKPKARRFTVAPMPVHVVPSRRPETPEELRNSDGCGRVVSVATIARVLGIKRVVAEFPSEFKRRVLAAKKVFLGETDSPSRSGGRGTPSFEGSVGEAEGQTVDAV